MPRSRGLMALRRPSGPGAWRPAPPVKTMDELGCPHCGHDLGSARAPGERRRPGRPSRFTPEVVDRFFLAIRTGNNRTAAARFAGIGPATLHRWMTHPGPEFREFRNRLDQEQAAVEVQVVRNLIQLTRRSTRAIEFWLRADPERRRRWFPPREAGTAADAKDIPTIPRAVGPSRERHGAILIPPEGAPEWMRPFLRSGRSDPAAGSGQPKSSKPESRRLTEQAG